MTSITTLLGVIVTLVVAITGLIKAVEAKNTAATVATLQSTNHAETVRTLDTVNKNTNGVLDALKTQTSVNAERIAAVEAVVPARVEVVNTVASPVPVDASRGRQVTDT